MATKARIGILTTTKIAKTIEVAYEGYPEYTGELLKTAFKTPKQVRALIEKGDIIQLEANLSDIEQDEVMGTAQTHRFVGDLSTLANDTFAEYIYLYQEATKTWYLLEEGALKSL